MFLFNFILCFFYSCVIFFIRFCTAWFSYFVLSFVSSSLHLRFVTRFVFASLSSWFYSYCIAIIYIFFCCAVLFMIFLPPTFLFHHLVLLLSFVLRLLSSFLVKFVTLYLISAPLLPFFPSSLPASFTRQKPFQNSRRLGKARPNLKCGSYYCCIRRWRALQAASLAATHETATLGKLTPPLVSVTVSGWVFVSPDSRWCWLEPLLSTCVLTKEQSKEVMPAHAAEKKSNILKLYIFSDFTQDFIKRFLF